MSGMTGMNWDYWDDKGSLRRLGMTKDDLG